MKLIQRANINALLSSLIWGLILSFAIRNSRHFITDDRFFSILWYGGNYLALMLYPLLASLILRKKINLWINVCFFSLVGGMLSVMVTFSLNAFQNKAWIDMGVGVFGLWLIGQLLLPKIEQNFAFQHELDSPFWEKLNQSSFIEFFFLRFHSIDNNAS